jgi:hypothetical protein
MKALLIGLDRLDPDMHGGYSGECPGATKDVDTISEMLIDNYDLSPPDVISLKDETATWPEIKKTIRDFYNDENEKDFVICYSGHGGQIPDYSGDEIDMHDETFYFYDNEISDDEFCDLLCKFKRGTNVTVITDCCNSGTICDIVTSKINAKVWHLAACCDSESTWGSSDGGAFTNALAKLLKTEKYKVSYWYLNRMLDTMLKKQKCKLTTSMAAKPMDMFLELSPDSDMNSIPDIDIEDDANGGTELVITTRIKVDNPKDRAQETELLIGAINSHMGRMGGGR